MSNKEDSGFVQKLVHKAAPYGLAAGLSAASLVGVPAAVRHFTDRANSPVPPPQNNINLSDGSFHEFEGEAAAGNIVSIARETVTHYFDHAVSQQGRRHERYKHFSTALDVDLTKMQPQEKIDYFRRLSAEWKAFTNENEKRGEFVPIGENPTDHAMEDRRRINLLRLGVQGRLDYLSLTGHRELLRQDAGEYFRQLNEWITAYEPFYARAIEAAKETVRTSLCDPNDPDAIRDENERNRILKREHDKYDSQLKRGLKGLLEDAQEAYRSNQPQQVINALNILNGHMCSIRTLPGGDPAAGLAVDRQQEMEGIERLTALMQEASGIIGLRRCPPPGLPEIGPGFGPVR